MLSLKIHEAMDRKRQQYMKYNYWFILQAEFIYFSIAWNQLASQV